MAYLRMPGTRPDRHVLVTVHSDGGGSISLAGNAVAYVRIDTVPVPYALKHGLGTKDTPIACRYAATLTIINGRSERTE